MKFLRKLSPKLYANLKTLKSEMKASPSWHTVLKGANQGIRLFLDTKGAWQKEMVSGKYDPYIYDFLTKKSLAGKTIYEIGSHVGYHVLGFAKLVGENGKIISFEPNKFNRERLELHVKENNNLTNRIRVYPFAVADKDGEVEFSFSSRIEDGTSSGSFISGVDTVLSNSTYDEIGFEKMTVKTVNLDQFIARESLPNPDVMKIDVEGAESIVLDGAKETIKNHRPTIIMEVHTISNMYYVFNFLNQFGYKIDLIHKESDGRCFISAVAS